jgi:hypothetical protein
VHPEHVQRAVSSAAGGSSVAVFADTMELVQDRAREIMEATPSELVERISRRNGDHYIDLYGGGKIRFMSTYANARSARGMSLDRVFVPIGTSRDVLGGIVPSLVTSREAVLTGY